MAGHWPASNTLSWQLTTSSAVLSKTFLGPARCGASYARAAYEAICLFQALDWLTICIGPSASALTAHWPYIREHGHEYECEYKQLEWTPRVSSRQRESMATRWAQTHFAATSCNANDLCRQMPTRKHLESAGHEQSGPGTQQHGRADKHNTRVERTQLTRAANFRYEPIRDLETSRRRAKQWARRSLSFNIV